MIYIAKNILKISEEKLCLWKEKLPHERLMKISSFKFKEDKIRCAAAYMLLVKGMSYEYNKGGPFKIVYNEYGKPFFQDSDTHFNISHSADIAVCAISDRCIGVDVQQITTSSGGVENIFFSPEEVQMLNRSKRPDEMFTKLWSVKESYFKYLGTGIPDNPNEYNIYGNTRLGDHHRLRIDTYRLNNAYLSVCSENIEKLVNISL